MCPRPRPHYRDDAAITVRTLHEVCEERGTASAKERARPAAGFRPKEPVRLIHLDCTLVHDRVYRPKRKVPWG